MGHIIFNKGDPDNRHNQVQCILAFRKSLVGQMVSAYDDRRLYNIQFFDKNCIISQL